jgi:hypothetical protein
MIKKNLLKFLAIFSLAGVLLYTPSCDEESMQNFWDAFTTLDSVLGSDGNPESLFGYDMESEKLEQIESDINLKEGTLPSSVDLSQYFPPIGNQGAYGTCVAWAVAYNLRSFMDAYAGKYSPVSSKQQFSPKDLFLSIPTGSKGANCNGSSFEPALDVLITRGVAKLETVPYSSLGTCAGTPSSGATSEAANHKIANYRKITEGDVIDINAFKKHLSQGRPVVIGARLGDNFMKWNSAVPIATDTYNEPEMMHAYHAMVVCGYDDNKGSGAFKVVNTWSKNWGSNGYIWVDYNFFAKSFCFAGFIANTITDNPDADNNNNVDPNQIKSGYDLVAWDLEDKSANDENDENDDYARTLKYNVFNSGETTISSDKKWSILYAYYNAYDAKDFGIIIYDFYTDDKGKKGQYFDGINGNNGDFDLFGMTKVGSSGNWWNNADVLSGESVAYAVYHTDKVKDRFLWDYTVPSKLTGKFYFVLLADGLDVISETNESNNYFFFADKDGNPLSINNGVIDESKLAKKSARAPWKFGTSTTIPEATLVNGSNPNTYTPAEIRALLKQKAKNGELQLKINEYLKSKTKSQKTNANK